MPVLKRYSESYDKGGYYVHAPIDGYSHPIPLQTPNVTAQIYRELGYESGDQVPNELTWKLYNIGLHWTENTGSQQQTTDEIRDAVSDWSSTDLTTEQKESILSIIGSYSGRFEDELYSLADELNTDSSPSEDRNTESSESKTNREYFGICFDYIDNQHYIDDLHTLEEYSCVYGRFYLEEYDEFRVCRIDFTSSETDEYVESIVARDEFLEYLDKGYSEKEAVGRISNDRVRKQVQQADSQVPAHFLTSHIESLICGTKPDRYEVVPKSKTQI
ncbi:hypothetical protein EXE41_17790 [Halorubrum sp. SD690R]|uniref:hypothetical protein n=1 Tax=Halorubrum sp. SD690R TaxID=2518117 RepID=UPI0010F8B98D|nr:hypothetical protein [Halorubrum sp. SD690R]TKX41606.1 hypothetical protein EXE41_17790 [Halorubrum sp. SD690R]